ncbi:insulinase family protein [bacterium]|nr:insulinase family protein [bacterium]
MNTRNTLFRLVTQITSRAVQLVLLAVSVFLSSESHAQDASNSTQSKESMVTKVTEVEGISEYRLENGVRVLLFPDASKEVVTVNMTVFVGSRHEGYGEAGMAHLLEHMLFKGTPTHPDIPKALKDRGAGRSMNGTTWMDRTNYYETLPATGDNLEFAIRLEADRLLNSKILGEDLESEMTVVRNEFERSENSPFQVMLQRMQAASYEWHNYGKPTIGNRSDIERVPVVKLREFYRKYYRPDNVMVIVAGKFETDEALDHLQNYFGTLAIPETPIDPTYTTEPAQDGERTVVVRRVGEVQLVGAAYHIPAGSHPDYAAAKALVYILGDEPNGRLYGDLVEPGVASSVYANSYAFTEPGLLFSLAEVPGDGSLESARSGLIEVMERSFVDKPVTDKEVARATQQILKQRELQASNSDRIAVSLSDWAAQGDWRLYFLFRDYVEKLTTEQVQQVAEKYFVRNNRTVGLFIPSEKSERIQIPEAPDLAQMLDGYKGREAVTAGEQIDPDPLKIEERTIRGELTGGIRYAMLPKKTRGETATVSVALRFGSEESLRGKVGAVELLGIMMARGTEKLDYSAIEDEKVRLRLQMSMSSTIGLLQISAKTKKEFLPEVVALLGDLIHHPRFDGRELDVIRRQIITSLEQSLSDPSALGRRSVERRLSPYPEGHVLHVMSIEQEIQMYRDVTIEQIAELHREFIGSQAGEVTAVGEFDAEELKGLLADAIGDTVAEQSYTRVGRPAQPDVPGSIDAIETPDKENAVYRASQQVELRDSDPQFASLELGNFILGGGSLSSRLGNRVRQQEGLSYGIASYTLPRAKDNRVDFIVAAITNPGKKDRLVEVINEELVRIRNEGITQQELEEAKAAYLQAARVRRSDDSALNQELLGSLFNERTLQHVADHEKNISEASVESVNAAIKKFIDPDKLVIAVAGDFAKAKASEQ